MDCLFGLFRSFICFRFCYGSLVYFLLRLGAPGSFRFGSNTIRPFTYVKNVLQVCGFCYLV